MKKIAIRTIKETDLQAWWEIAFGPDADLEWKKWDGPYFRNPILDWESFATGWGKSSIDNPQRKIICFNDKIVGILTAHWEDGDLQQWLEFGITIYDATLWSKGIGSYTVKEWITELFSLYPHIQRVGYTTWSGNNGMQKLGEKIGMTKEAQIRKVRFWQGQFYDSVKYGVLRQEWQALID